MLWVNWYYMKQTLDTFLWKHANIPSHFTVTYHFNSDILLVCAPPLQRHLIILLEAKGAICFQVFLNTDCVCFSYDTVGGHLQREQPKRIFLTVIIKWFYRQSEDNFTWAKLFYINLNIVWEYLWEHHWLGMLQCMHVHLPLSQSQKSMGSYRNGFGYCMQNHVTSMANQKRTGRLQITAVICVFVLLVGLTLKMKDCTLPPKQQQHIIPKHCFCGAEF